MTRYIDADALDQAMYHKSFEVDDGRNVWNSGLWIRYKIYEEASREAPTIEAVPVRHGHWIDCKGSNGKDYRKCSECLHTQEITGLLNYCPVCGAMMDGEHETD